MLEVLYEDEQILAIAKPPGTHVFSITRDEASLARKLVFSRPELGRVGDPEEPAFVHRLDQGTSGVLVAAKDDSTFRALRKDFSSAAVHKEYLALVEGRLEERLNVDAPLGSRYRRSQKVQVQLPGRRLRAVRPAETRINPVRCAGDLTLCRVVIVTGVRHQIRAHLAHLKHPVVGDVLYGSSDRKGKDCLCLHAWRLGLRHPANGELLLLTCDLPDACVRRLDAEGFGEIWRSISEKSNDMDFNIRT